jgi:type II secretory pathway pseudopilin PulG
MRAVRAWKPRAAIAAPWAGGFTYLALLFAVAIMAAGLASVGEVWRTVLQREKEAQLLFVGEQFRRAIGSFYEYPAAERRYPRSLEELLLDPRHPGVLRHLRRIYGDPMTGKPEWGLVTAPDGQIVGVFSLSEDEPIRRRFLDPYRGFANASHYSDWKFVYTGGQAVAETAAGPGTGETLAASAAAADEEESSRASDATARIALQSPEGAGRNECFTARSRDLATCEELSAGGNSAAAAACMGSAQIRLSACLRGAPLPPLRVLAR